MISNSQQAYRIPEIKEKTIHPLNFMGLYAQKTIFIHLAKELGQA